MELAGNTLIYLPSLITSALCRVKRISAGLRITFPAKLTLVLLKKTWEIKLNRDVPGYAFSTLTVSYHIHFTQRWVLIYIPKYIYFQGVAYDTCIC